MALICPLSLVTVALSKEPVAEEMNPVGAWAETSFPLPTMKFLGPLPGSMGYGGAFTLGTSRHSLFG